ncbi:hypothetical protein [Helicobacter sp. UBA3407]|uniref:hypothetical protein n=3 Tax=Helicobacteraceae TaxID=72293 RepID=UPI0026131BE0|nr:hypothetical protein [Helicobacter sp. UBA3407]
MHYYIYPKNWDGEDIAFNLSQFDTESTYHFIDDKEEMLSLKSQAEKIKQDKQSFVLIASKYRYFDLVENLKYYGISNYADGLKFCAAQLRDYYLPKITQRDAYGCSVGLLVTQLPHSEHSRAIIENLQAQKICIIFLVTDQKNFTKYQESYPKEFCLLARCDLLEYIDFISVAHATTHYCKFHSNVISILNPQGLLDPVQNYFYFNRERVDLLIGSRVNFDYIFCHTKEMLEFYQSKFSDSMESLCHSLKLIPSGYPSLDSYLDATYCHKTTNTILLAFTISNLDETGLKDECGISFEILCELVQSLLDKKYKVVLRPHPEKCKAVFMDELAKKFENVGGGGGGGLFVVDRNPRMSKEIMEEAFVIIGHGSSVVQTFPLVTFKPAILFIPDKEFFVRNDLDSKFVANQKTHILTHSVQEVLEVCDSIKRNPKSYQADIKNYRAEHIYNLGNSGEFIASFIKKLILKVQKNREYLKEK